MHAYVRQVRIFHLEGASYTPLENYTACFPVARDGEVHHAELHCDAIACIHTYM